MCGRPTGNRSRRYGRVMADSPAELEIEARIADLKDQRAQINEEIEHLGATLKILRGATVREATLNSRGAISASILSTLRHQGPLERDELARLTGLEPDRLSRMLQYLKTKDEGGVELVEKKWTLKSSQP